MRKLADFHTSGVGTRREIGFPFRHLDYLTRLSMGWPVDFAVANAEIRDLGESNPVGAKTSSPHRDEMERMTIGSNSRNVEGCYNEAVGKLDIDEFGK